MLHHHDASLEELTAVYLPTGLLKVTNVYFVLLILISKSYCRANAAFPSLYILCSYRSADNILLHCRCRNVLVYMIIVHELGIKTCRLSYDKAVLSVYSLCSRY